MGLKLSLQYFEIPVFQPLAFEPSFLVDGYICNSAPRKWPMLVTLRLAKSRVSSKNQCNSGCSGEY